ncbi:hypothetical protein [Thiobacillus denitrificans]|uniref:hypothetical protein n=1 Tax=Thiobacillus denitrificans TaxID=36861 RepID=UPI000372447A|nr:hypothetical protein [Thiobacillus denitrificans]
MKRALILVVVLAAIAAAGYWLKRPAAAVVVSCTDPLAGCTFDHRGTPAQLRFSSQPVPLETFELSVRAPGVGRISAELQMSDMDMGFNRYALRPVPGGAFGAKVTLPACVSGRHDWVLYLDIDGTRYALPFSTR